MAEMQFRLDDEDPASRAAAAALEWPGQLITQRRRGRPVTRTGARIGLEHAVDDLADEMLRQSLDIGVGRRQWHGAGATHGRRTGDGSARAAEADVKAIATGIQ